MIEITNVEKPIRYEFICGKCGCEYVADYADVEELNSYFGSTIVCNCPKCHQCNGVYRIRYEEE